MSFIIPSAIQFIRQHDNYYKRNMVSENKFSMKFPRIWLAFVKLMRWLCVTFVVGGTVELLLIINACWALFVCYIGELSAPAVRCFDGQFRQSWLIREKKNNTNTRFGWFFGIFCLLYLNLLNSYIPIKLFRQQILETMEIWPFVSSNLLRRHGGIVFCRKIRQFSIFKTTIWWV